MIQKIEIPIPPKEARKKIEAQVKRSGLLLIKKSNDNGFHFLSAQNYGSLSMIEKEYYHIKGKYICSSGKTFLLYEVKGNSTFRTLGLIIPIMLLPTIFILAGRGARPDVLTGSVLYLALAGLIFFWSVYQDNKLIKMGENNLRSIIEKMNIQI